jgi:transposase
MAHQNARTHLKGEKVVVALSRADAVRLRELLSRGRESVRVVKRARALQLLGQGRSAPEAGDAAGLDDETVRRVGKRFLEGGLEAAIRERPRPGQKPALDARQEAKLVALACSAPPMDRARWTISLLRHEVLRRGICDAVSETTIRKHLKRHALKPWREKKLVRGRDHAGIRRKDGRRAGDLRAPL